MKKPKDILGQFKEKDEIVSEWISDVNVRIEADKRFKNKKNKSIENKEKAAQ